MKNDINMNKSFRFVHIPKTGGTTFNVILKEQYPNHDRYDLEKVDFSNFETLEESQLFHGHSNLDVENINVKQASTVTFFRDPVDRVVSFIQHKFNEDKNKDGFIEKYGYKEINIIDLKLKYMEKCLEEYKFDVSNLQVKMLINNKECKCNSEDVINKLNELNIDPVEKAYVNLLEKTDSFGLMERYDESIILFKRIFAWKRPYFQSRRECSEEDLINKNIIKKHGGTRDKINEYLDIYNNLIKKIKTQNKLDQVLYDKVEKEFDKNIKNEKGLQKELISFSIMQRIYKIKLFFKNKLYILNELLRT